MTGDKDDKAVFYKLVKEHVAMLESCRTLMQMRALWQWVKGDWERLGQRDYAQWFERAYITEEPWCCWYTPVSVGRVPSVPPQAQAIEAFHNVLQNHLLSHLPAVAFAFFLQVTTLNFSRPRRTS